jgi:hypothetical protein
MFHISHSLIHSNTMCGNLSSSFFFHIYDLVNMDERRHKVLVALVFFMAIRHVMVVVAILQQLALHQL